MKKRIETRLFLVALVFLNGCQTRPTSWEYKRITHRGALTESEFDSLGHDEWILSGYTT